MTEVSVAAHLKQILMQADNSNPQKNQHVHRVWSNLVAADDDQHSARTLELISAVNSLFDNIAKSIENSDQINRGALKSLQRAFGETPCLRQYLQS